MADSIGFGVIISHSTTQNGSYTALAKISDCGELTRKRKMAKTTHNESADMYEECLPSLKDGGELSLKLNYDKTQHAAIIALYESNTQLWWKLTYADGANDRWLGHISEVGKSTPLEEREESIVKFQTSGKPIYATS